MGEPIWTQITIAVPDWYDRDLPFDADSTPNSAIVELLAEQIRINSQTMALRDILGRLRGVVYDGEQDPDPDDVPLWQCSGLANYGLNEEQTKCLRELRDLEVEYDASAEAKYEYTGEIRMWRKGWEAERSWTASADVAVMTEGEWATLRKEHLDDGAGSPASRYGDLIEAIDAFWPPPYLIEGEIPAIVAAVYGD